MQSKTLPATVATLLVLLIQMPRPVLGAEGGALRGVKLGEPIYGDAISANDLEGKVVFFEYWGTMCPPCRASFPHLIELQSKFGKTGRFQVVASHVQGKSAATINFLRVNKVNFPVYQQLRLPHAPSGGGIPSAYLFDHEGQIIARGEGERAVEAQAIIAATEQWIAAQLNAAEAKLDREPGAAMQTLAMLADTVAGMPQAKKVVEMLQPLRQDPNVILLVRFRNDLDRLNKQVSNPRMKRSSQRFAEALRTRLERFCQSESLAPNVKREAEALIAQIPQI